MFYRRSFLRTVVVHASRAGSCDDEVAGAVAAWDRIEAHAAARKHAAVAEFMR